jgi:hypothetical protein
MLSCDWLFEMFLWLWRRSLEEEDPLKFFMPRAKMS